MVTGERLSTNAIYTIGYSGFTMDTFLERLCSCGVNVLVDVRSSPYSAYRPEFNKEPLCQRLKQNRIIYRHYGIEFGARRKEPELYSENGCVDFEKTMRSEAFLRGVERVLSGMELGYTFVLMCAEKEPVSCHRGILVSRALKERGCDIIHLLPDGREISHEALEEQLLDIYFPDRTQVSMFDAADDKELLRLAYQEQNEVIGYRRENV